MQRESYRPLQNAVSGGSRIAVVVVCGLVLRVVCGGGAHKESAASAGEAKRASAVAQP